jgi:hypothetical protein
VVVIEPHTDGTRPSAIPLARAMLDLSPPGAVQDVVEPARTLANHTLAGKSAIGGQPTACACLGPQGSLPLAEPEPLVELLRTLRAARTA